MVRTKKSAIKRKEIVKKVINSINNVDFEELTIQMICDVAGISVGTFYHYFTTKNELLTEILGLIDDFIEEKIIPNMHYEDELENIKVFGSGFAEYADNMGNATGAVISSTSFPLPSTEDSIKEERKRLLYTVPKETIILGQTKGQIMERNVDEIVDMLIILLRGNALEWSRRNRIYDIREKVNKHMEVFIKMIKK